MGATIDEVVELANVEQFLSETGHESTVGACHNACCWLALQIKKAQLSDYNIYWAVGFFRGIDHSWMIVETDGEEEIVDMTIDQFVDLPVPYVGEQTSDYDVIDSISLCDGNSMKDFVEELGL